MLMHILGTMPTENFGKALEKYIRYLIADTLSCIVGSRGHFMLLNHTYIAIL